MSLLILINFISQLVVAIICGHECVGGVGGWTPHPLTLYQHCVLCTQEEGRLFKISIRTNDLGSWCVSKNFQEPDFAYVRQMKGCQILQGQPMTTSSKNYTNFPLTPHGPPPSMRTMTCQHCSSSIVYLLAILRIFLNCALFVFLIFFVYRKVQSRLRTSHNKVNEGQGCQGDDQDDDRHENVSNGQLMDRFISPSSSSSTSPRPYWPLSSSTYVIPQRRRPRWYTHQRDCDREQNWRSGSSASDHQQSFKNWPNFETVSRPPSTSSPPPSDIDLDKVQSWRIQEREGSESGSSSSSSHSSWRESQLQKISPLLHENVVTKQTKHYDSSRVNPFIFSSEEEEDDDYEEKNQIKLQNNNNNADDEEDDDDLGFELVTRKKRKIVHHPKIQMKRNQVVESVGKKKIFISTRRTDPHFLQGKFENLRRLKDLKNHIKFWKEREGSEWHQPKNFAKTIFPHKMKIRLETKVQDLIRNGEKLFQEMPQGSEGREEFFTYLALLDESGAVHRQIIDLGHSEAVQLTRRVDGENRGRINAVFVPSTPVQFIPFRGRFSSYPNEDRNNNNNNKDEVRFILHFDTKFIAHHPPLGSYHEGTGTDQQDIMMTSFSEPGSTDNSSGEDNDDSSDHHDGPDGDFWSVNNHHHHHQKEPTETPTRLVKRSKPYLLVDFIPFLNDDKGTSNNKQKQSHEMRNRWGS